jgi:hypothetical protein
MLGVPQLVAYKPAVPLPAVADVLPVSECIDRLAAVFHIDAIHSIPLDVFRDRFAERPQK